MVKVVYGVLVVLAVAALVAAPGCRGRGDTDDGGTEARAEATAAGGESAAGSVGAASTVSTVDARQASRLAGSYVRWTRMHRKPQLSRQHDGHMVVSFADKRAKETYRAGEGSYETYAAVAQEGWKDGQKKVTWFMQKRKPGYDPDNGDWWYATVAADGTVVNAGKVAACIACHGGADNDHVFGH